jgi:hypothetical protein
VTSRPEPGVVYVAPAGTLACSERWTPVGVTDEPHWTFTGGDAFVLPDGGVSWSTTAEIELTAAGREWVASMLRDLKRRRRRRRKLGNVRRRRARAWQRRAEKHDWGLAGLVEPHAVAAWSHRRPRRKRNDRPRCDLCSSFTHLPWNCPSRPPPDPNDPPF